MESSPHFFLQFFKLFPFGCSESSLSHTSFLQLWGRGLLSLQSGAPGAPLQLLQLSKDHRSREKWA